MACNHNAPVKIRDRDGDDDDDDDDGHDSNELVVCTRKK